jgi:predicted neutral ceramidase superfamily lipid hydrolase
VSVTNQVALAAARCTVNGQEVDCAEPGNKIKGFLGWGIGGFLVIFALGIWATVFWIMMIVHAAKYDVENKAMWIILMVFTGIVDALIYYFMVKRKFAKQFSPPTPTMR